MRREFAVLAVLLVSFAGLARMQGRLPAAEQAMIVAAPSVQQAATQSPYELTFRSGTRISIPKADVHDFATTIVRSALMQQASSPVSPANVMVLHIRGRAPAGQSHVDVTLHSGATVRLRTEDVSDARLSFLRTALAQAISAEGSPRAFGSTVEGPTESPVADAAVSVIRETCAKEWPDDFRMRAYCQQQQDEGLAALQRRVMSTGDHRTIRVKCATEWPADFRMRNYCEEQQLQALSALR